MVRNRNVGPPSVHLLNLFPRLNHSNTSLPSYPTHILNPQLAQAHIPPHPSKAKQKDAHKLFDKMPPQHPNQFSNWEQTQNSPPASYIYNCNRNITSLGGDKKVKEARQLFDKMSQRDVFSYASMITVYLKNGDLSNAEKLFHAMPGDNVVASSAMIDGYGKANMILKARMVFDSMPERNVFTWTSMISGYLRVGDLHEAKLLFGQMPQKNIVTWTTMILGCARNGLIDDARMYFNRMPEKNVVAWTVMMKCLVESNEIDQARKLFDEMPIRNLYSWNILLSGYLDRNRVDEGVQLFKLMPQRNAVSWTTMVAGLARCGLTENAREYFDEMPDKDVAAWNAMISAYADDGLMSEASNLFNRMRERNTVTWNAIIDGYSKNGPQDEALKHLIFMLRAGDRPNETTVTSVISACGSRVELIQAHTLVILTGFASDTSLTNALVTRYSRCGDISAAANAFKNLKVKDTVSWTAVMLAYSIHGYGHHALQAFACMLRYGAKPDHITFVAVLSACRHAGLRQKGQKLFSSMSPTYGIEPKAEHYSCLVDILGRSGHVNEALKVVKKMSPDKRDAAVMGALLGGCKFHGDIDVANQISEELIELEPNSSGTYTLLANIYARHGKWDEFASVRKRMKERKVKKIPGYSQIEVDYKSHMFFSGDRSHPYGKEVRDLLQEKLVPQMKEIVLLQENPFEDL